MQIDITRANDGRLFAETLFKSGPFDMRDAHENSTAGKYAVTPLALSGPVMGMNTGEWETAEPS